ncbi:MAG: class I SAM-dependent methyltransferase [Hydrococcus sp. C42_A2020_068]|uniref:class I SAM-dependent methyltransferase n=1 Tax=Pleurocapsa sp. PCC 7327 TaxID=118163 RepID=UPI00031C9AA8|nr:class I SAM-dependent methyltransferase [Pleurocapsa sp. PCC 7327]MBF2022440.1 class I SAM-dependent methyltransferase [Hydrococcus sp. C42_A2020_068]
MYINNATQRFSSRVENYIKYRPHYPKQIINFLRENCQLTPASIVADIGSGTGISSQLFLQNGNLVYGTEPNREMREAGERLLKRYDNFKSIDGVAEATTLANASADLIIAGQAFHWFDRAKAKFEFKRILKPQGWVVLMWNDRRTNSTSFLIAYEQLLQTYGTDYEQVNHKQIDKTIIDSFLGTGNYQQTNFYNYQTFNFEGLKERLLSSWLSDKTQIALTPTPLPFWERGFQLKTLD